MFQELEPLKAFKKKTSLMPTKRSFDRSYYQVKTEGGHLADPTCVLRLIWGSLAAVEIKKKGE